MEKKIESQKEKAIHHHQTGNGSNGSLNNTEKKKRKLRWKKKYGPETGKGQRWPVKQLPSDRKEAGATKNIIWGGRGRPSMIK